MKYKSKEKIIYKSLINIISTVMVLFFVFFSVSVFLSKYNKNQTEIFGFTVCKIISGSMEKTGYYKDDIVITKRIDENNLKIGDVISFYVHSKTRLPIKNGEDRSDMVVWFHEIVEIKINDGKTYYKTKGSSNTEADSFYLQYESVSGIYVETPQIISDILKYITSKNLIYFSILIGGLIMIKAIMDFIKALSYHRISRAIIQGKIELLNKKCLSESKIYDCIKKEEKQRLIKSAPKGLNLIYEYILFKKITPENNSKTADKLKNKRCILSDILYLTYIKERKTPLLADEYIDALPDNKKDLNGYKNFSQLKSEFKTENANIISVFMGFVLFTGIYVFLNYLSGGVYDRLMVIIISVMLLLCLAYLIWMLIYGRTKLKEGKEYFNVTYNLPDYYNVILSAETRSEKEVSEAVKKLINAFSENENGNTKFMPKYRKSFMAKLIQADDNTKRYYSKIKNELLSYKRIKSRISNHFDTFAKGRFKVAKLVMSGKTLVLYLALNPDNFVNSKYRFIDVGDKKQFKNVPMRLKIKSNRSLSFALLLIGLIMQKHSFVSNEQYVTKEYAPLYKTTEALIEKGLIILDNET